MVSPCAAEMGDADLDSGGARSQIRNKSVISAGRHEMEISLQWAAFLDAQAQGMWTP
jgi:hypothetical protein